MRAPASEELFFLVRPGTSIRAAERDGRPVLLTRATAERAVAFYERLVPLFDLGALVAVSVDEYHRGFTLPQQRAKAQVAREAREAEDGEVAA